MRIKLGILGVEDFGIYNVVGGVVGLFTFLNVAMTGSTKRFLNFALGQNDTEQARNVYSASIVLHVLIAVLVVILAQTVGLWLFHTWLNIPIERQNAAFVVYQLSIASAVIGILQVPYEATIIAHEKMSFFAKLSIVESMLKLGIVFLLSVVLFDKLIAYAFLICITGIVFFLIYKVYCNRTFEIAHFRQCLDKDLFRQLLGFSGWNVFGGLANTGKSQGVYILVNIFHGVTVNAAMGIAGRVNSMVVSFLHTFQKAIVPQITKSYAAKEFDYFERLIFRTSKVSFCLLFFVVLPLYINAGFVLQIWLINIPEYLVAFTRLSLLFSLVHAIAVPLYISIQATGDIKKFQLIGSSFRFSNLPLSLLFLWMGFSPVWVFIVKIGIEILILVWIIFFLGGMIKFPVIGFFRKVIVPVFITALVSVCMTFFVQNLFVGNWSKLIASCVISTVSIGCLMYWVVLNRQERLLVQNQIKTKIRKDC